MSQHDLDIANQGFPATRADINNALQALGSSNSGATAPSTTYANQLWYDTANNIVKIRNEDNDAWISLLTLDQSADAVTQIDVDNIRIDGNTISSTDTNGNVTIDPAGTGDTIIASGNLGIGTTPAQNLHVSGGTDTRIRTEESGGSMIDLTVTNSGHFIDSTSTGDLTVNKIGSANMVFKTGNTERVRIDANGNLGVGQTSMSGSNRLYSTGSYAATTGQGANLFIGDNGLLERSTSSQRYKNTINDATHGLAELMTLRPVTYKHNSNGDMIFGGLIAEEVHTAGLTEFVEYSQDDNGDDQPEALHYGNMVSLCIKAIQELKTDLDAEKAKTATLQTQVADLTTRVAALEA